MGEHAKEAFNSIYIGKPGSLLFVMNRIFTPIEERLNLIGVYICMALMFLTVADIVCRYIFRFPLMGIVEISEMLVAPLIMFAISYTQRLNGHVGMGLIIERLKGRTYHLFRSLILLIALITFSVFTLYTFKNSLFSLETGENTPILLFPMWPSKVCVPIGSFFLCIRFCIQLVQHLVPLFSDIEKKEES